MTISILLTIVLGPLLLTFAFRLERGLHRFQIRRHDKKDVALPSVSVCVPARNETHAMTQCLERVLASDYRKMEVIVFDDESADDTSILINSFAHAGVRFVPGTSLPEGWLGKNHALDVIAREASGSFILFLDVDTHIAPSTITQLVDYAVSEELQMVSVIPGRNDVWRPNVLFGHLRYYWKILLSRERSPATSSSLWMIKRHTLLDTIGGFKPHKAEVEPESRMAALIGPKAYRCLVNTASLGVSYEKRLQSQYETSRRLLYPMTGGTWLTGLVGMVLMLLLNVPLLLLIAGVFFGWSPLQTLAVLYLVGFATLYSRYTHAIWRSNWWLAFFVWPIVIFQELILFSSSLIGYAKGTITWKGRPVAAPQPLPELPLAKTNN
jgi:glycosyltransferase involved in cell wall biosynthesis